MSFGDARRRACFPDTGYTRAREWETGQPIGKRQHFAGRVSLTAGRERATSANRRNAPSEGDRVYLRPAQDHKLVAAKMLLKCLTILSLVLFGVYADEKDVLELTDETFESELERHENTLVMFYAPWWDRRFSLVGLVSSFNRAILYFPIAWNSAYKIKWSIGRERESEKKKKIYKKLPKMQVKSTIFNRRMLGKFFIYRNGIYLYFYVINHIEKKRESEGIVSFIC